MVTGYGLTRLALPIIPDSLIALMGLSLGTAGISHYQMQRQTDGELVSARKACAASDLICVIGANGSGELWAVPWEMVTLMGMSQADYLAPGMGMQKTEVSKIKDSD